MIEAVGQHFLYNIGAKKFVKRNGNRLALTDNPEPIDVSNGTNGIVLANQTDKQWALVSNEIMSVNQAIITGIDKLEEFKDSEDFRFNLAGQRLSKPTKGINIVNGRKVLIK